MKLIEISVVLFITQYIMILTFKSLNEILKNVL